MSKKLQADLKKINLKVQRGLEAPDSQNTDRLYNRCTLGDDPGVLTRLSNGFWPTNHGRVYLILHLVIEDRRT
jgi:hypothetical protein